MDFRDGFERKFVSITKPTGQALDFWPYALILFPERCCCPKLTNEQERCVKEKSQAD